MAPGYASGPGGLQESAPVNGERGATARVFLVTGATGRVGTEAVSLLARDARRPEVRVATRDVDGSRAHLLTRFAADRVRPVPFDVDDARVLAAALDGVTDLIVVPPLMPDMEGWHRRVADAARAGGCRHIVKVSVTGAREATGQPAPGPIPLQHFLGEEALRESGIPTTAIRPTIFSQHFGGVPALYQAGADEFYLPIGDARVAFLDCRDVAMMAVALLWGDRPAPSGDGDGCYELTGPQGIRGRDIAEILTAVAGRPIRHVDGSDAYLAHAAEEGLAEGPLAVYADAAEGSFSEVSIAAFTQLTGRSPRTFAEFAADHAALFAARTRAPAPGSDRSGARGAADRSPSA